MENTCKDCKYYLPVDVFKGICKLEKNILLADDQSCKEFAFATKCKFCVHYTPEKNYIGRCQGDLLAYPDMNAITCSSFKCYGLN